MSPSLKFNIRYSIPDDVEKIDFLAELINQVYEEAEKGLFKPGLKRISPDKVSALIAQRELLLAEYQDQLVGCIHFSITNDEIAKFGMLVAHPDFRGTGVGRELVKAAELLAKQHGCSIMRLELLTPAHWHQPHKEFLKNWYMRLGYVAQFTEPFDKEEILVTPCHFTIYYKQL